MMTTTRPMVMPMASSMLCRRTASWKMKRKAEIGRTAFNCSRNLFQMKGARME
jgi:hypothetical protein